MLCRRYFFLFFVFIFYGLIIFGFVNHGSERLIFSFSFSWVVFFASVSAYMFSSEVMLAIERYSNEVADCVMEKAKRMCSELGDVSSYVLVLSSCKFVSIEKKNVGHLLHFRILQDQRKNKKGS